MAVVVTTGTLESLKFGDDFGFANVLRDAADGPRNELLIIWFGEESRGPVAVFTTELTAALTRNLRVRLSHEDDSAYITQVVVEAAAP